MFVLVIKEKQNLIFFNTYQQGSKLLQT